MRSRPNLFFAGQITGVEGYMESASSGLLAGINAVRRLKGTSPLPPARGHHAGGAFPVCQRPWGGKLSAHGGQLRHSAACPSAYGTKGALPRRFPSGRSPVWSKRSGNPVSRRPNKGGGNSGGLFYRQMCRPRKDGIRYENYRRRLRRGQRPLGILKGCAQAVAEYGLEILLTGPEEEIRRGEGA